MTQMHLSQKDLWDYPTVVAVYTPAHSLKRVSCKHSTPLFLSQLTSQVSRVSEHVDASFLNHPGQVQQLHITSPVTGHISKQVNYSVATFIQPSRGNLDCNGTD